MSEVREVENAEYRDYEGWPSRHPFYSEWLSILLSILTVSFAYYEYAKMKQDVLLGTGYQTSITYGQARRVGYGAQDTTSFVYNYVPEPNLLFIAISITAALAAVCAYRLLMVRACRSDMTRVAATYAAVTNISVDFDIHDGKVHLEDGYQKLGALVAYPMLHYIYCPASFFGIGRITTSGLKRAEILAEMPEVGPIVDLYLAWTNIEMGNSVVTNLLKARKLRREVASIYYTKRKMSDAELKWIAMSVPCYYHSGIEEYEESNLNSIFWRIMFMWLFEYRIVLIALAILTAIAIYWLTR